MHGGINCKVYALRDQLGDLCLGLETWIYKTAGVRMALTTPTQPNVQHQPTVAWSQGVCLKGTKLGPYLQGSWGLSVSQQDHSLTIDHHILTTHLTGCLLAAPLRCLIVYYVGYA
jgi:hypothetical protein